MRKIILFNGPPRSGKDLCAQILFRLSRANALYRFSDPLKWSIPAFFDQEHADLEAAKDEAQGALLGYSYRDLQISLSEEWAKTKFGPSVFGELLARRICHRTSKDAFVVVPDSGFPRELVGLYENLPPPDRLLVIRLLRPGKDFSNDSRGYLDPLNPELHYLYRLQFATLVNDESINTLQRRLTSVICAWEKDL